MNQDPQSNPPYNSLDRFIQPFPTKCADFYTHIDLLVQKMETRYQTYLKKQLLPPTRKRSQSKNRNLENSLGRKQFRINKQNKNVFINQVKVQHEFKSVKVPKIVDDFYLNLLDWSKHNLLAIGLQRTLYSWTACSEKAQIIFKQPKHLQICSVKFNEDKYLAVGNNQGAVKIYDMEKWKQSQILVGHLGRVSSLDWYNCCLASGSRDGYIIIWDLRTKLAGNTYKAHSQQISGLKWNNVGSLIASGGNDNKLVIFDSRIGLQLVKFQEHKAAIKGLDWCPSNEGIVASGGGTNDKNIRFFNTKTLSHQFSIETGSQICNLAFSKISNEMITTHGYSLNQINIWNSNNLWKTKQSVQNTGVMLGHSSRVLYLAMNPTGDTIATAAGDKMIKFWHPFSHMKFDSRNLEIPELR